MPFLTQIAEITECLYLSSIYAITKKRLLELQITDIINCTLKDPSLSRNELNLKITWFQISDNPQSPLDEHFDKAADIINDVDSCGGKVLVHCVAGVSRSATLCIAYLMKYKQMKLKEAHDFVKGKRKIIHPNSGFWEQLIIYERKLFGTNTVAMVTSNNESIPDIYIQQKKDIP